MYTQRVIIIVLFTCFAILLLIIGLRNRINKTASVGSSPINKYLFLLAKLSFFIPLALVSVKVYNPDSIPFFFNEIMAWAGISFVFIGILFVLVAYLSLGVQTKFGLAEGKSKLVTSGIYKYSRNPMYVGLYLLLAGVFLYLPGWIVGICIIGVLVLHHKIILAEEKYLEQAFGDEWKKYKSSSKRYL